MYRLTNNTIVHDPGNTFDRNQWIVCLSLEVRVFSTQCNADTMHF